MTRRLYHNDASLLEFHSTIRTLSRNQRGSVVVVLEESAFYPESGGQMADHGSIEGFEVTDVQVDDDKNVEHHLRGDVNWQVGERVHGKIDGTRRREHRQLHTGQHLLSQAAIQILGAKTLSSRLGETGCTLDLDLDAISEDEIAQLLDVVHHVIDENRPVQSYFPDDETLQAYDLRRSPKVSENIRVVDVEGFDATPCGGTHCTNTSEVGLLHIFRVERVRQKVRLCFDAGARARSRLLQNHRWMTQLVEPLNASDGGIVDAVLRLQREVEVQQGELSVLELRWAEALATSVVVEKGWVVLVVNGAAAPALSLLSDVLFRRTSAEVVCLFSPQKEHAHVLFRSVVDVDCRQILSELTKEYGGKGGGKAERAQGKLPSGLPFAPAMQRIQKEGL